MAYIITNQCSGCVSVTNPNHSRCYSVCPTQAVQQTETQVQINSDRCNNCVGFYSTPQCVAVCPGNHVCVPAETDYWQRWFKAYNDRIARLNGSGSTTYWERWFDVYSHQLSRLTQSRSLQFTTH